MLDEVEVPVLGMMEVGEATVHQGTNEIERQRGALVAAQQELRIGGAVGGGERRAIDEVAAIGRKRDPRLFLEVRGARFRVLPREAADADDPPLRAVHQHQAHLQQDFELAGDDRRGAVGEALGAVATLEQERLSGGGVGELTLERLDLPGGDERRQRHELAIDLLHRGWIGVDRLLPGRKPSPRVGGPAAQLALRPLNRR